jgi:tetratricopeptide (TPR) repeat protein
MKKTLLVLALFAVFSSNAQSKSDLQSHYEAFYKEMRSQGDVSGVINALTHLNVIAPSQQRRDTLAFVYMQNNQNLQALNTIGIESSPDDSDLAVQVKAVTLKALNQPKRAIVHFESMFKRKPNSYIAYELADLKIQVGDNDGAEANIAYGLTNVKDDMKHAFYERQQPYEVSLKAALTHLQGLLLFNKDKENIDAAISYMDEALKIDPNFNLASLSKQALESRKAAPKTEE